MSISDYTDLINDLKKLLKSIQADPPGAHPFVVCLPGTFKAYLNIH